MQMDLSLSSSSSAAAVAPWLLTHCWRDAKQRDCSSSMCQAEVSGTRFKQEHDKSKWQHVALLKPIHSAAVKCHVDMSNLLMVLQTCCNACTLPHLFETIATLLQ